MAGAVTAKGLNDLIRSLGTLPEDIKQEIDFEIKATALDINRVASQNIQQNGSIGGNGGALLAGQQTQEEADGSWSVFNDTPYAIFVEFGTGAKVRIPAGWEEEAAKGKSLPSGKFTEFYQRILEWVKAKNIAGHYSVSTRRRSGTWNSQDREDKQAAYAIMLSIYKHGANPHPYFIPAVNQELPKLFDNVNRIVKDIVRL